MRRSATRWVWLLAVAAALAPPGCSDEPTDTPEELELADFYLTVKFATNFRPEAVDQLDVYIYDALMLLEDSSGEESDGGISWESGQGASGDELHLTLTGDYILVNAMEVSRDSYEIDIPFLVPDSWRNSPPADAAFSVRAEARWEDPDGELQQIGRGTGQLPMPPHGSNPITIVVNCDPPMEWAWTCRTGCADGVAPCAGDVEDCGSGTWDCVDGCCADAE